MEDIEDADFVASEHDQLVSSIAKLDKTQHITDPTRNEPSNFNSEFNLVKRNTKLDLKNVANVLQGTAHHVQISKKLKKIQDASKVLRKPLEKPQAERIKRSTGYEETKKKVGRWDAVVARNRTIDYVAFPLKHTASKLEPTNEFITKFELKSELEKQLEEIDPKEFIELEEDEEKVYPMSYDEMMEHRQHLAKLRAQQSYKAAKAKKQSKIKSKKFHRILKKERLKQQLKEFEELQKKDPEEALKKLEAIEKTRALERHTLRHKNTGKWAKNLMVRAKYDKEARQQIAEQLAVSRSLTQKTKDNESSEGEADENETIPNINLLQDPMNPWMLQRTDKSNVDAEFNFGYKKYLKEKMKQKEKSDSDSETDNLDNELSNNSNFKNLKESISKLNKNSIETSNAKTALTIPQQNEKIKKSTNKIISTSKWVVTHINETKPGIFLSQVQVSKEHIPYQALDDVSSAFEKLEDSLEGQVGSKIRKLKKDIQKLEEVGRSAKICKSKSDMKIDSVKYLELRNQKKKAIIDKPLIEGTKEEVTPDISNSVETNIPNVTDTNIDPNTFIQVKPKYLNTALPEGNSELDILDDDEQVVPKVSIEEVFEEDDVVASFQQEKQDEIDKDKPEELVLSLPGWGSWGGKGVKPTKRKRNRFIMNYALKTPRRDENKGDVIIKEFKDPKLNIHKVTDVPFPFTSVKEYEASIRAPIGNTFIPERAHQKLIRPSIITKAGVIIEPIDEDELLVKRNRHFKNELIIKTLAKQ